MCIRDSRPLAAGFGEDATTTIVHICCVVVAALDSIPAIGTCCSKTTSKRGRVDGGMCNGDLFVSLCCYGTDAAMSLRRIGTCDISIVKDVG